RAGVRRRRRRPRPGLSARADARPGFGPLGGAGGAAPSRGPARPGAADPGDGRARPRPGRARGRRTRHRGGDRPLTDTDLPQPADAAPAPPPAVPVKFLDPETGAIRVEALLKSYLALERKLSGMVPLPGPDGDEADRRRLLRALGVPETPE